MYQSYFLAVRAVGILAAFQYAGVAAFEAEAKDVERHVGTSLVDHADDTKWNAHTTESQAVG